MKRKDVKESLILAAERVVSEEGISGSTSKRILEVSDVSNSGAINYYFDGIPGLLKAVFEYRRFMKNTYKQGALSVLSSRKGSEMTVADRVFVLSATRSAMIQSSLPSAHYNGFYHRVYNERPEIRESVVSEAEINDKWQQLGVRSSKYLARSVPDIKDRELRLWFALISAGAAFKSIEDHIQAEIDHGAYDSELTIERIQNAMLSIFTYSVRGISGEDPEELKSWYLNAYHEMVKEAGEPVWIV
jgi:AcrR family transcriptional regulator